MTFPGYPLSTAFTNSSPNRDVHPAAHNDVNAAANDLQDQITASAAAVRSGTGSPEGVVTAPVGTLYRRTDGGTNTTLWVKETGGSGNTGWVANAAGSPDGGDAGTLSGSTKAFILARTNHTGTQSADTITDGTTNKAYTGTEQTKLASVAANATAITTYSDVPNFATGWEATRRAKNIRITWETGDTTAKLDSTVVMTDATADSGTDLDRSIQTTAPPNSGSATLATPHLRLACPAGVGNGNSRYFFPITGSTSVDSRLRSLWLGHTAGAQMGHFHRLYTRASSSAPWAFVVWYDVLFGVDSLLNLNTWENDITNHTLIQGSGIGEGGADLTGIQKWVDVYASTKSATTVTLIVPQSHGIVVGQNIFVQTENLYDASVTVTAVAGNKITYTSGTSQTIAFGGAGNHANGAGIMCRNGILPYWVESELVGNRLRAKAWPVGRTGPEPSYGSADYSLQMTATGTYPTTAGKTGVYAGHTITSSDYVEYGGPVEWTNLDA